MSDLRQMRPLSSRTLHLNEKEDINHIIAPTNIKLQVGQKSFGNQNQQKTSLTWWRSRDKKDTGRADIWRVRKPLLRKVEWEQSSGTGKSRCQIPVVGGSVANIRDWGRPAGWSRQWECVV